MFDAPKDSNGAPENNIEETVIEEYLNYLAELWNIEPLKGNADQIHNAKKVISSFTDPRNRWFSRTKAGLCTSAYLEEGDLEAVLDLNKSTFMTSPAGKVTLRVNLLCIKGDCINRIYKLNEVEGIQNIEDKIMGRKLVNQKKFWEFQAEVQALALERFGVNLN